MRKIAVYSISRSLALAIAGCSGTGAIAQSYVPHAPTRSYAQKLVDRAIAEDPDLLTMSIVSKVENTDKYQVIATNIATSLGAAPSDTDMKVMRSGEALRGVSSADQPIAVSLPLHDVKGASVGVLDLTLSRTRLDDVNALMHANQLRGGLESVIPNLKTFYDQFYYIAAPQDDLAMQIISQEMIRHPDLWVLAFHCIPPGDNVNRLIGINYVKLMNQRSENMEDVLAKNGNTALEAFPATHRVETHIAMRDQKGQLIGTLATVYLYKDEADLATVLARTVAVRNEVQRSTPSLEALVDGAHQ